MAYKNYVPASKKKEDPKFPSSYGSHVSMIDEEMTEKIQDSLMVVCKDLEGFYVTSRKILDNKLADPHRYSPKKYREKKLKEHLKEY